MASPPLSQDIWKLYGFESNPFEVSPLSLNSSLLPIPQLFVGHSFESKETTLITNILRSAGGARFVIEGEIGVGKTTFLNYHRFLWYSEAQDKLFTPIREIPVSPDWETKDFILNVLDALIHRIYLEKGEKFILKNPLLKEILLLTKVYIRSKLEIQASAYGFGIGINRPGDDLVHVPDVPEYSLTQYFRSLVEEIKKFGYVGVFLHFDNLELISLKYPEKIQDIFERIRDILQIRDVYFAFIGNLGFFTEIINPLERVRSIFFGFPIQLPSLTLEEVIKAISLRYKVLAIHDSFINPFEDQFIEYLYHLYEGKIRFIMDALHSIILYLPMVSPVTLSKDKAREILRGVVLDKIRSSLRAKEQEILNIILNYETFTNTKLAKELRMSPQNVSNYLGRLMELNFIYIVKKVGRIRYFKVSETVHILKESSQKTTTKSLSHFTPSKRQEQILKFLRITPKASSKEIKESLSCSKATVLRDLNVLIEKKLITKYGTTRNAYYSIIAENSKKKK